jgi:hypothetical protein
MKKQTAVEWLVDKLETEAITDYSFAQTHKVITLDVYSFNALIEQAKQMEKEQMFEYIKNLYCNGDASLKYHLEEFEQYYDKTYRDEDRPTE